MGIKSRNLDEFNSHLNCGGDGLPAGWAVDYGDDTSSVAEPYAPGGDKAYCDFAGDTAWDWRIRFTGTDLLDAYRGKYRPFLRCQQSSGDAGDINVKLRVYINSTDDYAPVFETPEVALEGTLAAGGYFELVDLYPQNKLQLPFVDFKDADVFTEGDIIIEVWCELTTGAATLDMFDLILIPADEWTGELDDPLAGEDYGNSALRGLTALDFDGGVLANRTIKYVVEGTQLVDAETWSRHAIPILLNPYTGDHRLYFILAHYPEGEDWGDAPLCSRTGMDTFVEFFTRNRYHFLRGDD